MRNEMDAETAANLHTATQANLHTEIEENTATETSMDGTNVKNGQA
ncbi:hypothetical protein GXP70_13655 [Paenibacillus lycopersici]|uniref:Uncharacterized protein n=1 Tax=Paenibacillus lycopersici TaxID=2704462 RepID=A0A6C0FZJ2_9BACL|nr:hypothetical protein [Paenibacillus lycopersici]QHT60891.1 hypothetical protein GXP70_13655 [Paenibacillus lycopersici]